MLPPICDVFQTNLPDLLSVVCFFLRVACQKKSLSNFPFSALCIFTFNFSNTVRESIHTRTGTNPLKFINRTGLFFQHQRHFYPLATLQSTYKIQAALGIFFRNNFSMLRSFHAGVFCAAHHALPPKVLQPYFLQTSRWNPLFECFLPYGFSNTPYGIVAIFTKKHRTEHIFTRMGFTNKPLFEH